MDNHTPSKRVAVIGAGIYGCTAAYKLAAAGHVVTLFEQAADIMTAASAINQYRLHRGYHYPRSQETILSCLEATPLFEAEYNEAVISACTHHYAIAKEDSFVTAQQYLGILDASGLPYKIGSPDFINMDFVEMVIEAEENLYDPYLLKQIVKARLEKYGVTVQLNAKKGIAELDDFDFIIVAAYASLNSAFDKNPELEREYQFEVCEKIVVEIPSILHNKSIVVMDGPFMSFDPLGNTGYAVMGHVEHAIHSRNIGTHPEIPKHLEGVLNHGIIKNPEHTNINDFINEAGKYITPLAGAVHVGSMYTVRTVLPRVDKTDTRPTIVDAINHRVISIYSGKVGNSVKAANEVVALINSAS